MRTTLFCMSAFAVAALGSEDALALPCLNPDFMLEFSQAKVVEGSVERVELVADRVLTPRDMIGLTRPTRQRTYRAEVRILNVLRGRPEAPRLIYEYLVTEGEQCPVRRVAEREYLVFTMVPSSIDAARRTVNAHARTAYDLIVSDGRLRDGHFPRPLELGLVPMNR